MQFEANAREWATVEQFRALGWMGSVVVPGVFQSWPYRENLHAIDAGHHCLHCLKFFFIFFAFQLRVCDAFGFSWSSGMAETGLTF